jgi:hypothetical protein
MLGRGLAISVVCLGTSVAGAQKDPFIGEWKVVPAMSRMPDAMRVESKGRDTYAFDFGGGVETIVVDGSDQPGLGGTQLSVKAEASDVWIVRRKQGSRVQLEATWKLSGDGSQLTDYYREFEPDGSTFSVDYVYAQAGDSSGRSGFAAAWRSIKETINSPFVLKVSEFGGDGFSFVDPLLRRTIDLRFGGMDRELGKVQEAGGAAVSTLRRVDQRTLQITNMRGGKTTFTEEFALAKDQNTLTMTVRVVGREDPYVLVFERK